MKTKGFAMLELTAVFGGSFTLALSGALMPGPLLTVTIGESVKHGFKVGPLLMTGHAILELFLVVAITLGLGPYLESPPVMGTIALVGGLLLIYLGVDMIRAKVQLSLEGGSGGNRPKYRRHPILIGILASLANPYWTLWWATIGLGYLLAVMNLGLPGLCAFFLGHIAADYAWYSLVSFGVSRGKGLFSDRSYRYMVRACGALLLGFGGWFLISAKGYLTRSLL
jgi:threonine/homoserine/homoserine lactone efflux protein